MKEDKDTIKVCADGADAVKENNEADTYHYNDVMSEYYNLAGFFADKEANNCLENVFSKCGDIYEWDEDAACVAAGGTEYRCNDQDPDKKIVLKSCVFTGNMKCPSGHGLVVGTSGITIDGNGYAIGRDEPASTCAGVTESNPSGGDCGIYNSGHDRVTITKLEILHFCNGIGIQGSKAKPINGNIIEHCKIHDNGNSAGKSHGIHMVCVKGTTIRNNEIYKNRGTGVGCGAGGNGIFLYAGGIGTANNDISGNDLHDNARAGFWTKQGMQGCTINNNKVWGNSRGSGLGTMTGGLVLQCEQSNNNLIDGNEVRDNYGRGGIFIGGNGNTLSNNKVHDNTGDGINIGRNGGSRNNELNGNTICDNEDMDIRTCGMDYGNTGDNNYCDTTDNYEDTNVLKGSKCTNPCSNVTKPDLEVTEKFETWIVEGTSYNVTYTVQNIGEVNANASTTHIQIVNGDSKDDQVPALAPNATYTSTVGPFTMSDDSDTITVCADYEGLVEKHGLSSWDNNCLKNKWWALPDLIVTEILLPDRLSFGMPNLITARIENAGTVKTNGTFTVALFIVPSTVPIYTAPAPSELTAGNGGDVELKWTPPAPGRYTLRVVADYGDAIPESNEDNNEKTRTITEELGIEMPEGPKGGGGGGGGVPINKENVYGPEVATGEISTGEATKEVPINETKQVKEEKKMGTGHPFGEGGMTETVKVVAPVFLVVALITIVVVLFYLGYRKERKMHKRGDKKIR
jgi:parallel beta-helix repeat protein